jgi:hypothetical protein
MADWVCLAFGNTVTNLELQQYQGNFLTKSVSSFQSNVLIAEDEVTCQYEQYTY